MVLAKSKNAVGLGNSLMNDRFKNKNTSQHRGNVQAGIKRTDQYGNTYITNNKQAAAYEKMRSVTEQAALDEFLSTAELAGTDFTAEKMNNVEIIHKDQKNPYLLSAAEERSLTKKQNANRKRLTVPRRPPWDEKTTAQELDERERQSLLGWRRGLAEMQEGEDMLLTPFERNLEVWRQLWRVIERSDLVVQIVDARNPLLFRCEDLERYVKEVDERKNNLLLVNKADMMTLEQRQAWANYFVSAGINYKFFSAELAKERNEAREVDEELSDGHDEEDEVKSAIDGQDRVTDEATELEVLDGQEEAQKSTDEEELDSDAESEEDAATSGDEATRILTTDELEALFLEHSPKIDADPSSPSRKTQIGLVGYPNVGKSSTINALIGAKKVSVSATPGKTKHFQTIHLSESVVLCDCPGLVFPNFATTKAELVCSGVLPIDQLREFTGPAALVAQRIPKSFLEAIYGLKIHIRPIEEGGTGITTAEELLSAYARARGFSTTGVGSADESRAARYVLKDYVRGKLLYCHPPPADPPIDGRSFNRALYDLAHLPQKRRAVIAAHAEGLTSEAGNLSLMDDPNALPPPPIPGVKSGKLDERFFARGQGHAGHLVRPVEMAGGRQLTGRKLKNMIALEKDVDPAALRMNSKKHFKANKRKGRPRAGYEV